MNWKIVSWESIKGGTMRYLKPLRPFFAWSQLSIPTVYDDSLSYYEVLNKCIFHFNEMLKIMQENYEIIDEAFAKILEECEAAIARCEEAAARAEAAQSAAEKAQAAAEAAQAAAEAAQKLAEAAQAAAEAARDDAVTAQKAAEAAQAAAEAAQAAAEAAQQKAETAQAAAEAAQAKAEDAQEKAESARDAAEAAQAAAEAAQQKAEEAQNAAESARDAAEAAQRGAEAAQEAAEASEQAAADSAADAAASAEEIKNALDNYYDKTESDNTFVKKAGDTMTGNLVMEYPIIVDGTSKTSITPKVTLIPANTDLNNFLKPGSYSCVSTNVISTIKNMPENREFLLINSTLSQDPDSETITFQTFIAVKANNVYTRFIQPDSSILTDWNKLIGGDYLPLSGGTMTGKINVADELNDTFTGLSKGNYVTYISKISDLNNVKSNCVNVYSSSVATSEESKNFPDKIPGFLVSLVQEESETYVRQVYYGRHDNVIYTRLYDSLSSSWSNWDKILFETDIVGNYLPLSGGTMTGNILGSKNYFTSSSNKAYFDGFSSGLIIHPIPEGNPDINNVTEPGIYYTPNISDNFSNIPEDVTSYSWYMITKYPSGGISVLLHNFANGKMYVTKNGIAGFSKITPNSWVRLDNVSDTNDVKVYQVKETEHLRFITYDLGDYYKVEGYTKIQLAWKIPQTIESNPVVGTVYKYSTFTDFDEIGGTDPYTMSSDNHINVCTGLDYFRPNGFTSGTSAGNMLSNIVFNDSAGKFYFEIQITWPDSDTWNYIGNHYNVLIDENSLIGTLIVPK